MADKRLRKHLQEIGGVRVTTSLSDLKRLQSELKNLKAENYRLRQIAKKAEHCAASWRNTSSLWEAAYKKLDKERDKEYDKRAEHDNQRCAEEGEPPF